MASLAAESAQVFEVVTLRRQRAVVISEDGEADADVMLVAHDVAGRDDQLAVLVDQHAGAQPDGFRTLRIDDQHRAADDALIRLLVRPHGFDEQHGGQHDQAGLRTTDE